MGNEQVGNPEPLTDVFQISDDLIFQVVVQGGERFIHKKQAGVGKYGPADGNPLLLAPREVVHPPIQEVSDLQHIHQIRECNPAVLGRTPSVPIQEVAFHIQVGKQVGMLEDHADPPLFHRDVLPPGTVEKSFPIDYDNAGVRLVKAGNEFHKS